MASVRAHTRLELEAGAALGVAAGLLLIPASGAQPRKPCSGAADEVAHCLAGAVRPYVMHAVVGAAIGTAVALLLVLAWRANRARPSGGFARRSIPERVRHEVWRRDRARCVDCGSRGRLEFDHIIPVSRGGSNTARNLELRCEPCNRGKGARI